MTTMNDAASLLAALEKMQSMLGPLHRQTGAIDFTLLRKHHGTFVGVEVFTSPIVPKGEIWFETDAGRVGRITNIGEPNDK
jgi:hypothetical protein